MQKIVKPDISTFTVLMSVFVDEAEIDAPMFYWAEMKKIGLQPDIKYLSYSILLGPVFFLFLFFVFCFLFFDLIF
jgi:hypothetical protein